MHHHSIPEESPTMVTVIHCLLFYIAFLHLRLCFLFFISLSNFSIECIFHKISGTLPFFNNIENNYSLKITWNLAVIPSGLCTLFSGISLQLPTHFHSHQPVEVFYLKGIGISNLYFARKAPYPLGFLCYFCS